MTIDSYCRIRGWRFERNELEWRIVLPFKSPVEVVLVRMSDGRRYRCSLDSDVLFRDLKASFSLNLQNCPPGSFRADASFIDDGFFFNWLEARINEQEGLGELEEAAEALRQKEKTETSMLIAQRKGQSALRKLLMAKFGAKCMATGVSEPDLLVASHIKGWRECKDDTGAERLDIDNVLLLAKNIDALFDRHYISFEPTSGKLVVSKRIPPNTLRWFGVTQDADNISIPIPNQRQRTYLEWHLRILRQLDGGNASMATISRK